MTEGVQVGIFDVVERRSPLTRDVMSQDGTVLLANSLCYDIHLLSSVFQDYPDMRQYFRSLIQGSMHELAHYAKVRSSFFNAEFVIGTTYPKLGRLAAKGCGFGIVPRTENDAVPTERIEIITEEFGAEPMIIWMPVQSLIHRFWLGHGTEYVDELTRKMSELE